MKNKSKSGFTIIEAVISIAIFSILFLTFMWIILLNYKFAVKAKRQYQATNLAQKHFEELKASYSVAPGSNTHEHDNFTILEEITEPAEYEGKLYRVKVQITCDEQVFETIEGIKIIKK